MKPYFPRTLLKISEKNKIINSHIIFVSYGEPLGKEQNVQKIYLDCKKKCFKPFSPSIHPFR